MQNDVADGPPFGPTLTADLDWLTGGKSSPQKNGVALKWKERQNHSSAMDIRKVDLMGLLGCVQNGSK